MKIKTHEGRGAYSVESSFDFLGVGGQHRVLVDEAVESSVTALPGPRRHPREAVLAVLSTCTVRDLGQIASYLRRPRRVVEKWATRLRRVGVVGYSTDWGWFLRSQPAEPAECSEGTSCGTCSGCEERYWRRIDVKRWRRRIS